MSWRLQDRKARLAAEKARLTDNLTYHEEIGSSSARYDRYDLARVERDIARVERDIADEARRNDFFSR